MNPDTIKNSIQAVVDGLTPLAQKLQVPLEGLWGWAIRHNYALAGENFFIVIISCVVLFFTIKAIIFAVKLDKADSYKDTIGYWLLGIMGSLISLVFIFVCGITVIDRLIAPEWNTAKDISCLVHSCHSSSNN